MSLKTHTRPTISFLKPLRRNGAQKLVNPQVLSDRHFALAGVIKLLILAVNA